ncbi:MAG: glutamate--tRNA ligase [Bacteroidota bacterium]
MERKVRVRFAPSPTGPLHIGGVRTALYNYLFAKKHGGDFLLRIEDTDQTRFVPGAEEYIIESMNWLGIPFSEGVGIGGPHAPYKQSERKPLYKQYADDLIAKGFAYYAFDSGEELENIRKSMEAEKKTFIYNAATRGMMKNSFTLSEAEVNQKLAAGEQFVIRFKIPDNEEVLVNDIIRGEVRVHSAQLDDKVLFKSDGMPTYHLANVVDDYLMEITHVIRGEEWLPSAPLHVLLYRSLGWENKMPQFAHLPLLLKPDGNGKLSKRDGDRLGFPVFPLQWKDPKSGEISSGYRESGYFPDAVVNILAFLGWNPGTTQEVFSLEELVEAFSLERVGKAGAKFDLEKAKWFNHHYLVNLSAEQVAEKFIPILKEKGIEVSKEKAATICGMVKERAHFISELWAQSSFFFIAPDSYDEQVIKKKWKEETPELLRKSISFFQDSANFEAQPLHDAFMEFLTSIGVGPGQIMNIIRLALVGSSSGPDLFAIMNLLGKEETVDRLNRALETIK